MGDSLGFFLCCLGSAGLFGAFVAHILQGISQRNFDAAQKRYENDLRTKLDEARYQSNYWETSYNREKEKSKKIEKVLNGDL